MYGFLGISLTVLQYLNSELEEWCGRSALIQLISGSPRWGRSPRISREDKLPMQSGRILVTRNLGDG